MTRANRYRLKDSRFRLDVRKKFFTVNVVKRLPSSEVDAPSLVMFKDRMDVALSDFM